VTCSADSCERVERRDRAARRASNSVKAATGCWASSRTYPEDRVAGDREVAVDVPSSYDHAADRLTSRAESEVVVIGSSSEVCGSSLSIRIARHTQDAATAKRESPGSSCARPCNRVNSKCDMCAARTHRRRTRALALAGAFLRYARPVGGVPTQET